MKKLMRWGALFILSATVHADCETMVRSHWSLDVAQQKISTVSTASETETFCEPIVQDPQANLRLEFKSGKKIFERLLYVPRVTIHEQIEANKELRPAIVHNKILYVESHIPLWAKGATLTITSLPDHKVLGRRQ